VLHHSTSIVHLIRYICETHTSDICCQMKQNRWIAFICNCWTLLSWTLCIS